MPNGPPCYLKRFVAPEANPNPKHEHTSHNVGIAKTDSVEYKSIDDNDIIMDTIADSGADRYQRPGMKSRIGTKKKKIEFFGQIDFFRQMSLVVVKKTLTLTLLG
jgi:hypothetical protein